MSTNPCLPIGCPTSTPEFPSTINLNTTNNILNLADNAAQFREEVVEITDNEGELTYLPINTASTHVYVNGQLFGYPADYTFNGKKITFDDDALPDTYEVVVKYITRDTVPAESIAEVGTMVIFSTDVLPSGWILCDGSLVSQTAYADLYAVIGHDYIVPALDTDEATLNALVPPKFRLPNLTSTVYDGTQYVTVPLMIKH